MDTHVAAAGGRAHHAVVAVLEENMGERACASAVAQVSPVHMTERKVPDGHDRLERHGITSVASERR